MDPNATLQRIIEAAWQGEADELQDAAQDLASWFRNGGFAPTKIILPMDASEVSYA